MKQYTSERLSFPTLSVGIFKLLQPRYEVLGNIFLSQLPILKTICLI